jgi:hypothetical protein
LNQKAHHPVLAKLLELLIPAADPVDDKDRSEFERFALPHDFKPRLSFSEAVVSVATTLTRIFLGSLLFAVWGTYSFLAWNTIHGTFLRAMVLLPLLLLFFLFFALLMIAISAIQKVIFQHLGRL